MKRDCKYETWIPDYIEGTLGGDRTTKLEEHLAGCSGCLEAASLLARLNHQGNRFEPDPVPPELAMSTLTSILPRDRAWYGPIGRLGRKAQAMASLALGSLRAIFDRPWQFSPARGPESLDNGMLVRVKRIFEGTPVEIEVERTGPGTALLRILLPHPSPNWRNARVTLKRGRREIGSYPLDDGYVLIEDIDFGRYNLLFSRNGTEMGRYHFQIRETSYEQ